jgi:hypothetical protein
MVLPIDTPAPPRGRYLELPGIQEMVFAVWLIAKGFNPSAIAALSAKTE